MLATKLGPLPSPSPGSGLLFVEGSAPKGLRNAPRNVGIQSLCQQNCPRNFPRRVASPMITVEHLAFADIIRLSSALASSRSWSSMEPARFLFS
jgi:hypothetical protein